MNFKTSDGKSYTGLKVISEQPNRILYYTINGNPVEVADCFRDNDWYPDFIDNNYAIITFDETPSGDLLTWLQANATPI